MLNFDPYMVVKYFIQSSNLLKKPGMQNKINLLIIPFF